MIRTLRLLPLSVFVSVAALPADVTYEETYLSAYDHSDLLPALFHFPSGADSAFDNAGYDPAPFDANRAADFRVYIGGAKLARVGPLSVVIYDLDNATVTNIEALTRFAKTCHDKFAPRYAHVCALTRSNGFGIIAEAESAVPGYVVARTVETRSRAAAPPRPSTSNEPWNCRYRSHPGTDS